MRKNPDSKRESSRWVEQSANWAGWSIQLLTMTNGIYPVKLTSPEDLQHEQSTGHPIEKTVLKKGAIAQLSIRPVQTNSLRDHGANETSSQNVYRKKTRETLRAIGRHRTLLIAYYQELACGT